MRSLFRFRHLVMLLIVLCFLFTSGFAFAADKPPEFAAPSFQLAALTPKPDRFAPKSAPVSSTLVMPAPSMIDCPNCTTCGNGCHCFGAGYYCADGKCPIEFNTSAAAPEQWVTVCENGKCRLVNLGASNAQVTGPPTSFAAFGGCASCGPATSYSGTGTMTGAAGGCGTGASGGGWWLGKHFGREKPTWRR